MVFEIRFSGDANLKDSKFYFVTILFDSVYYLIMNVIAVFMENIHCGAVSSAQFHASMWRRMI